MATSGNFFIDKGAKYKKKTWSVPSTTSMSETLSVTDTTAYLDTALSCLDGTAAEGIAITYPRVTTSSLYSYFKVAAANTTYLSAYPAATSTASSLTPSSGYVVTNYKYNDKYLQFPFPSCLIKNCSSSGSLSLSWTSKTDYVTISSSRYYFTVKNIFTNPSTLAAKSYSEFFPTNVSSVTVYYTGGIGSQYYLVQQYGNPGVVYNSQLMTGSSTGSYTTSYLPERYKSNKATWYATSSGAQYYTSISSFSNGMGYYFNFYTSQVQVPTITSNSYSNYVSTCTFKNPNPFSITLYYSTKRSSSTSFDQSSCESYTTISANSTKSVTIADVDGYDDMYVSAYFSYNGYKVYCHYKVITNVVWWSQSAELTYKSSGFQ